MPGRFAKSFAFTIAKLDEDKRQVFGWASVVTKNGQPVVDRQGDVIPVETLEEAAYCSNTTSPPLVTTLSLRPATASRVGVIQTGYLEAATPGRPQQSRRRRSANRHWTSSSMDENVGLWRNREFGPGREMRLGRRQPLADPDDDFLNAPKAILHPLESRLRAIDAGFAHWPIRSLQAARHGSTLLVGALSISSIGLLVLMTVQR